MSRHPAPDDALRFAAKWSASSAKQSAGAKEHFIVLCRMLGCQTPNDADATGDWYAFEKGAEKTEGGGGFADAAAERFVDPGLRRDDSPFTPRRAIRPVAGLRRT